ncbi:MAG TPA: TonB-dependent receptor plug domain-containing protein [Hyphomonadaceae bacterium]|jgi:hypothetical protein|nr:TonB-dependent receptor plug domain-containing protein [Hyphomonadaceae bacterium]
MTVPWGRVAGFVVLATAAHPEALAQQTPPDTVAPPDAAAASNVTPYKPDFFTQFRPNTAMDMIGRIPGFSFDGGSGARGFSGTGGNVLIDGERPPSRGDDLSSIIGRIPASGVERIDVIRGGAEGIDMQGKPIVANIIRKKDAGLTGSLSSNVNVNSFGGVSPNATVALRNQSGANLLDGSIGLFHNQGNGTSRRYRVGPDGVVQLISWTGTDNQFDSAEATGAWETLWLGGKLRINGKANLERFDGFAQEGIFAGPVGNQISNDENNERSGEAGIRWVRSFSGTEIELVGFQSYRDTDFRSIGDGPRFTSDSKGENTAGESILRTTMKLPAAGTWKFDGGAEGVFNFTESSSVRLQNGAPVPLTGDAYKVDELRGEVFGTATWAPSSQLSVESGLRFEGSRITAENEKGSVEKSLGYLKPRLNVSWSPAKGHQWGFEVERVVGQLDLNGFGSSLSFDNGTQTVGSLDIEPEKSWAVTARYERQFGGQNSVVLAFEHVTIENFLASVVGGPPNFPETRKNIDGSTTRDALSLDTSTELDKFGMPGGIFVFGADLRTSHVTDPVTGEDRELSNNTDWSWNVSLQQTLDGGKFRWGVFAEDDADFQQWSPRSYFWGHDGIFLGANMSWKPTPNWTLGGGVNNIIAEDSTNYSLFYNAPRGIGSLQYRQDQTFEARRQFFVNARLNF